MYKCLVTKRRSLSGTSNMVKHLDPPEEHAEGVCEAPDGCHVAYGPPGAAAGGVVHLLYPGRAQARVIVSSLLLQASSYFQQSYKLNFELCLSVLKGDHDCSDFQKYDLPCS